MAKGVSLDARCSPSSVTRSSKTIQKHNGGSLDELFMETLSADCGNSRSAIKEEENLDVQLALFGTDDDCLSPLKKAARLGRTGGGFEDSKPDTTNASDVSAALTLPIVRRYRAIDAERSSNAGQGQNITAKSDKNEDEEHQQHRQTGPYSMAPRRHRPLLPGIVRRQRGCSTRLTSRGSCGNDFSAVEEPASCPSTAASSRYQDSTSTGTRLVGSNCNSGVNRQHRKEPGHVTSSAQGAFEVFAVSSSDACPNRPSLLKQASPTSRGSSTLSKGNGGNSTFRTAVMNDDDDNNDEEAAVADDEGGEDEDDDDDNDGPLLPDASGGLDQRPQQLPVLEIQGLVSRRSVGTTSTRSGYRGRTGFSEAFSKLIDGKSNETPTSNRSYQSAYEDEFQDLRTGKLYRPVYLQKPVHLEENVPAKIEIMSRRGTSQHRGSVTSSSVVRGTTTETDKRSIHHRAGRRCSLPTLQGSMSRQPNYRHQHQHRHHAHCSSCKASPAHSVSLRRGRAATMQPRVAATGQTDTSTSTGLSRKLEWRAATPRAPAGRPRSRTASWMCRYCSPGTSDAFAPLKGQNACRPPQTVATTTSHTAAPQGIDALWRRILDATANATYPNDDERFFQTLGWTSAYQTDKEYQPPRFQGTPAVRQPNDCLLTIPSRYSLRRTRTGWGMRHESRRVFTRHPLRCYHNHLRCQSPPEPFYPSMYCNDDEVSKSLSYDRLAMSEFWTTKSSTSVPVQACTHSALDILKGHRRKQSDGESSVFSDAQRQRGALNETRGFNTSQKTTHDADPFLTGLVTPHQHPSLKGDTPESNRRSSQVSARSIDGSCCGNDEELTGSDSRCHERRATFLSCLGSGDSDPGCSSRSGVAAHGVQPLLAPLLPPIPGSHDALNVTETCSDDRMWSVEPDEDQSIMLDEASDAFGVCESGYYGSSDVFAVPTASPPQQLPESTNVALEEWPLTPTAIKWCHTLEEPGISPQPCERQYCRMSRPHRDTQGLTDEVSHSSILQNVQQRLAQHPLLFDFMRALFALCRTPQEPTVDHRSCCFDTVHLKTLETTSDDDAGDSEECRPRAATADCGDVSLRAVLRTLGGCSHDSLRDHPWIFPTLHTLRQKLADIKRLLYSKCQTPWTSKSQDPQRRHHDREYDDGATSRPEHNRMFLDPELRQTMQAAEEILHLSWSCKDLTSMAELLFPSALSQKQCTSSSDDDDVLDGQHKRRSVWTEQCLPHFARDNDDDNGGLLPLSPCVLVVKDHNDLDDHNEENNNDEDDDDMDFPSSPHADRLAELLNIQSKAHSVLHVYQGIYVYRVDCINDFYAMGPTLGAGGEGHVKICIPTQIVRCLGLDPHAIDWDQERTRKRKKKGPLEPGTQINPRDFAYAMKITPRQQWKSELDVYSMAHSLGALRHPNVLNYRAFYEDDSNYFFLMDLVDGPELLEYLTSMDEVTEGQCRQILEQILKALKYIHGENLIHRDIKPENFVCAEPLDWHISKSGRNKRHRVPRLLLIDFGLACYAQDAPYIRPNGTPMYMAPELFLNSSLAPYKYDQRIDIWAAGVILCQLLTGRTPFDQHGPAALIEKVTRAELFDATGRSVREDDNFMSVTPGTTSFGNDEFDELFKNLVAESQGEEQQQLRGCECPTIDEGSRETASTSNLAPPAPRSMSEQITDVPERVTLKTPTELDNDPSSEAENNNTPNAQLLELSNGNTPPWFLSKHRFSDTSPTSLITRTLSSRGNSVDTLNLCYSTRHASNASSFNDSEILETRATRQLRRQPTSLFGKGSIKFAIPQTNASMDLRTRRRSLSAPELSALIVSSSQLSLKDASPSSATSRVTEMKSKKTLTFNTQLETVSAFSSTQVAAESPTVTDQRPSFSFQQRPRSKSVCFAPILASPVEEETCDAEKDNVGRMFNPEREFYRMRLDLEGEEWAHVTPQAKDLVRLLLTLDPEKRPTAEEALRHEWFTTARMTSWDDMSSDMSSSSSSFEGDDSEVLLTTYPAEKSNELETLQSAVTPREPQTVQNTMTSASSESLHSLHSIWNLHNFERGQGLRTSHASDDDDTGDDDNKQTAEPPPPPATASFSPSFPTSPMSTPDSLILDCPPAQTETPIEELQGRNNRHHVASTELKQQHHGQANEGFWDTPTMLQDPVSQCPKSDEDDVFNQTERLIPRVVRERWKLFIKEDGAYGVGIPSRRRNSERHDLTALDATDNRERRETWDLSRETMPPAAAHFQPHSAIKRSPPNPLRHNVSAGDDSSAEQQPLPPFRQWHPRACVLAVENTDLWKAHVRMTQQHNTRFLRIINNRVESPLAKKTRHQFPSWSRSSSTQADPAAAAVSRLSHHHHHQGVGPHHQLVISPTLTSPKTTVSMNTLYWTQAMGREDL